MTNLEKNAAWLKDIISYYRAEHSMPYSFELAIGELYQMVREKKGSDFEPENFVDWLSEEYKELIRLKQWERDLLKSFGDSGRTYEFEYFLPLKEMKNMGYFEGVKDTSMELGDILGNCEVVE